MEFLADIPALLALVLGLVFLVGGGELLVRGAAALALKANIPPLIIGLTVVSMGTSAPELFASVEAALEGHPGLAVGNVLGSNVANLALILGLTALIRPVTVDRMALRLDIPLMLGASLLFVAVASDLEMTRSEGIGALVLMGLFIASLFRRTKQQDNPDDGDVSETGGWASKSVFALLGVILVGTGALYFGSEAFVDGASRFALHMEVSDHVIGMTVVAFGTSLPEIVASGMAAWRGQSDLAVGNVVGSNLFNLLLVLGTTATIMPLPMGPEVLSWDIWWVLGTAAALIPLALLSGLRTPRLGRWQGGLFVLAYIVYIGTTWTGL
ncbi:MAG: calcium/sodium antiporter [Bacteroidota bacterium]|nr:calcium/sodium antiporter [Bacteroidota bacterium]